MIPFDAGRRFGSVHVWRCFVRASVSAVPHPRRLGPPLRRVHRLDCVLGSGRDYRKPRTLRDGRSDLNAVAKYIKGPSNDKQTYSQPVAARGVEAFKCIEDSRQLLWCDADAGVVDVDPHFRAGTAASYQDAPPGFGVFDCIGNQIAEDPAKEYGITHNVSLRRTHPHVDTSAQRCVLVLIAQSPEQRCKRNGGHLQRLGALVEANGTQQTIELLSQPTDRPFTAIEPGLFRHAASLGSQEFASALNDLEWLEEGVPRHAQKRSLKIAGAVEVHCRVGG